MNYFTSKNLFFTSLGCSKNLVDSQVMIGTLQEKGLEIVNAPEKADVIIINTCSFINAAKEESIQTILELASFKEKDKGQCKALIVSGCLPQRYSKDLETGLPEVDFFIGTGEYFRIANLLKAYEEGNLKQKSFVEIPKYIHTEFDHRLNTSPFYTAWLKVSEGCNRHCTFCIIPTIRGQLRSRPVASLIEETKKLIKTGVKEINIISQDLSDYGKDIGPEKNNLFLLLKELDQLKELSWIRIFYYYPEDISDEVLLLMSQSQKICPYIDMPIQHFSTKILKKMNRHTTGPMIREKIKRIRSILPHVVFRTSIIVGFPSETEDDFEELLHGVQESEFDYIGIFRYSDEDNTPASRLLPKISTKDKDLRFKKLFNLQKKIWKKKIKRYIGQTIPVLIEGAHPETDLLVVGRHQNQAPDVDGQVIITDLNGVKIRPGDIVPVFIEKGENFDLFGKISLS